MGGQQFGTGALHVSTARMNDVLAFDAERGIVTAEAGIRWPALIDYLLEQQTAPRWSIMQKQTGADQLSIGGSISTNIHGRGLTLRPLVQDIEAFRLVTAAGEELTLSHAARAI
ncbi:MAG: FAD-dependent oxidoreductase [Chromatiales bacterium]|nr:MAG: FAD-dependent oxidoreductase [Chromatiales bacterium]